MSSQSFSSAGSALHRGALAMIMFAVSLLTKKPWGYRGSSECAVLLTRRPIMKSVQVLGLVILALMLAACGAAESPEHGAREWVEAVSKLDVARIAERTCLARQQQEGYAMEFAFSYLGGARDLSGLSFTTANQSGQSAEVHVSGQVVSDVFGEGRYEKTFLMQNEGGRWTYCGEQH